MVEAHDKQQGFIESVKAFDVRLISKDIKDNIVELVFDYKMTGADSIVSEFKGKHRQTWENGKIVREEYFSIK